MNGLDGKLILMLSRFGLIFWLAIFAVSAYAIGKRALGCFRWRPGSSPSAAE